MGKNPNAASTPKGKEATKKKSDKPWKKKEQSESKAEDGKKEPPKETWSKSKKKRMRMLRAKQMKNDSGHHGEGSGKVLAVSKNEDLTPDTKGAKPGKSKLLDSFKARLSGSRFRILNEELYTTTSQESYDRFSKNPELFEQYHEGFRHQVESWPVNPVDVMVNWLGKNCQKSETVVADFGCGDAQLAKDLLAIKQKGKCHFKVHSFDLVSPNELVTACDMANVPLKNKSVDVCIFCLSLMGTNLADFIREAHRVLKDDGKVKIAEVRSRIEYSHSNSAKSQGKVPGGTTTKAGTLDEFIDVLEELGFKCNKKDLSNKMFLVLELEKTGKPPNKKMTFSAKPCIYKRR